MSWQFLAPEATLLAAILAALVSLISLRVNKETQKRVAFYTIYLAEDKAVRAALQDLIELSTRVNTSIRRLVELAPQKSSRDLMFETTHTLAIVSELFNKTSEDKLDAYPKEIASALVELREELANFFLILDYNEGKLPGHLDKLKQQQQRLATLFLNLRKVIKPYVALAIEKLPGH